MRTWIDVAHLAKTKNLQGGFVVRSAAGLPFLLEEGIEVAFVPPALDAPRRARVETVVPSGEQAAVVTFDIVRDIDTAEKLAGCHCLVRRADLPEGVLDAPEADWAGWQVRDACAGMLGMVASIEEMPGQMMLEVAAPDGRAILIPLVDEFVVEVDEDARLIEVDVPSGLLDL
ncbi:MAG: 16S rRNA processing protein RimM [Gordonibacter sp.]|uniref:ribosome maturation factor RimM n=1 Tax=Gordonibacter sp. TaxID=1968902 RepID=UPI002FC5C200